MTRRVAIFASVSTPQQASIDKDSLPSKERDGRSWAKSVGGDVIAVYQAQGHSRIRVVCTEADQEIVAYRQLREDPEAKRFDLLQCRARDLLGGGHLH